MKLHELKIKSEYLLDIQSGLKTFEVRKDDRGYEIGDLINFKMIFLGDILPTKDVYKITYILRHDDFPEGVPEGYCVLSIKELEEKK